jgi:uncharacterized membrane protein
MTKAIRKTRSSATTVPAPSSPRRDRYFIGLLVILALAAGLRLYAVETANFWLDEFWTLEISCGHDTAHEHLPTNVLITSPPNLTSLADARPWWTIWTSVHEATHPPLFFMLLRGWRAMLGGDDMATRLLPCLASLAGIALLYHVVRRVNGPVPALWACLLMAISGQQIFYAQEVRSYSLIVALGLAACAIVVEIEQRGLSALRLLGLSGLALAMLMTHYFAAGAVLALAVYAAIRLPRAVAMRVIAGFIGAGILFLVIWGPFFLAQQKAMRLQGEGGASFLLETGSGHFLHTLARLAFIPAQSIAPASYILPANMPPLIAWAALPIFILPLLWLRRRPDLLLWYLWTAGVVLPLILLDLTRSSMHLAFPRYTLLAAPGIFAVVAAGFDRFKTRWKYAAPVAVIAACALFLPTSLAEPASKPDWQPIATVAADSIHAGDVLVITAPPDQAKLGYLYVSHYLGSAHPSVVILTQPASPSLERELRSHQHVWVISAWAPMPELFTTGRFRLKMPSHVADFGEVDWPAKSL